MTPYPLSFLASRGLLVLACSVSVNAIIAHRAVGSDSSLSGSGGEWRRVRNLTVARQFHGSRGSFYDLAEDDIFEHKYHEDSRRYPSEAEITARVGDVPAHLLWEYMPTSGEELRPLTRDGLCSEMQRLGLVRLIYAGDSSMRQMFRSLLMLLGPDSLYDRQTHDSGDVEKSYSLAVKLRCPSGYPLLLRFVRTVFLCQNSPECQSPFGYKWMGRYAFGDDPTLLVVSTGLDHDSKQKYEAALAEWIREYEDVWDSLGSSRRELDRVVFRTSNPGHDDCSTITRPLSRPMAQSRPRWASLELYNGVANRILRHLPNKRVTLLDTYSMTQLRADGHVATHDSPGLGGRRTTDCLSYQLPGVVDWWNHLLLFELSGLGHSMDETGALYPSLDFESVWGSGNHGRLLETLNARGQREVKLACMGGSSTVGAGAGGRENSWFNKVAKQLSDGFENVSVHNAASSTTNTVWSWMVMDALIEADPDIVFWEYAINDAGVPPTDAHAREMEQAMGLWLRRVSSLPSRPALVFVYLYDPGDRLFYSSALEAQLPVIQRLSAAAGLDVLVVPAGPIMRRRGGEAALAPRRSGAKSHHPKVGVHTAIAKLVSGEITAAASRAAASPGALARVSRGVWWSDIASEGGGGLQRVITGLRQVSTTLNEPRFGPAEGQLSMRPVFRDPSAAGDHPLEGRTTPYKVGAIVPRCHAEGKQGLYISMEGEDLCGGVKFVALEVGVYKQGWPGTSPGASLPSGDVYGPFEALELLRSDASASRRISAGRPSGGEDSGGEDFETIQLPSSDVGDIPKSLRVFFNMWINVSFSATRDCGLLAICTSPSDADDLLVYAAAAFY